ncbi:MAG: hypothetical protein BWY85_02348 [Firmicutes bacterium ADurb.Bin506]|jgi:hypothetical protein|nr:MAG: hypothetical protein BWY85_02348 [Firmicutes bacterium ADurb.Bin506]
MRLPSDPECVALVRALKPFLTDKGQHACDDVLGALNLLGVFDALGGAVRSSRGRPGDRPLAFLSNLAYMDLDPKIIAKAVDTVMSVPRGPIDPEHSAYGPTSQASSMPPMSQMPGMSNSGQQGPKPEDISRMLQGVMARAAQDPSFAAMLSSMAEEGMRGNTLPKLMEMLGPDLMQGGERHDRS